VAKPPVAPVTSKVPKGYSSAGNGLAYRWAKKNLACNYGTSCITLVLYAMEPCKNIYVEANVLNRNGAVIGYTNELVQSLNVGKIAKVRLDTYEDAADAFQITEINCY
jgi:hypothetical protein